MSNKRPSVKSKSSGAAPARCPDRVPFYADYLLDQVDRSRNQSLGLTPSGLRIPMAAGGGVPLQAMGGGPFPLQSQDFNSWYSGSGIRIPLGAWGNTTNYSMVSPTIGFFFRLYYNFCISLYFSFISNFNYLFF